MASKNETKDAMISDEDILAFQDPEITRKASTPHTPASVSQEKRYITDDGRESNTSSYQVSRGGLRKSEKGVTKIHAFRTPKKGQKILTPSKYNPKPVFSPLASKDIFSSKKHSMNYVTVDGVKLRTGYDDKKDWYLICIKELLDNSVDFYWQNYRGASDAAIEAHIEKTSNSLLRIKVKNSNPKNIEIFTLEKLNLIFDFDMTYERYSRCIQFLLLQAFRCTDKVTMCYICQPSNTTGRLSWSRQV
jgi:hypothetical protein